MRHERIVIIGAGPAGCAAAVQCQRLGVTPHLLDRTGAAGGLLANAFTIDNYPGLEPLPGPEFAARLAAHLARFDIAVTRAGVTQVASAERPFRVRADTGDLRADCVILAVGTLPRALTSIAPPDAAGGGLYYEVRDLYAKIPAPRRVLVIGGGEAALDYALTLARLEARVSILIRGHSLRAGGRLARMVASHPAIELVRGAELEGVCRNGRGVTATVRGPAGPMIERVDAVLIAIGRFSAAPALLAPTPFPQRDGITSGIRGLFVAGDARSGSLGQAGMAVGDGLAAAQAAVRCLEAGADPLPASKNDSDPGKTTDGREG